MIKHEPRHVVALFFAAASVHLTSDFEGSPNSVKESLACGVPIVAANVGNIEAMISDVQGVRQSHRTTQPDSWTP